MLPLMRPSAARNTSWGCRAIVPMMYGGAETSESNRLSGETEDSIREVTTMLELNSIIAIYENQTEVNTGVRDLQQDGFDLRKLSILGREHESGQQVIGYYSTGSHMRYWGARGEFWNGSWKLL